MKTNIEFEEHNHVDINIRIDDVSISGEEYEKLARKIYMAIDKFFGESEDK